MPALQLGHGTRGWAWHRSSALRLWYPADRELIHRPSSRKYFISKFVAMRASATPKSGSSKGMGSSSGWFSKFANYLKVLGVIGLHGPPAAGDQAGGCRVDERFLEEAALVVATFGPGVGVVNVQRQQRVARAFGADEVTSIGPQDADIPQVPTLHAVDRETIKLVGPFDAEKIALRIGLCPPQKNPPLPMPISSSTGWSLPKKADQRRFSSSSRWTGMGGAGAGGGSGCSDIGGPFSAGAASGARKPVAAAGVLSCQGGADFNCFSLFACAILKRCWRGGRRWNLGAPAGR